LRWKKRKSGCKHRTKAWKCATFQRRARTPPSRGAKRRSQAPTPKLIRFQIHREARLWP
jgi:hypothetical protein